MAELKCLYCKNMNKVCHICDDFSHFERHKSLEEFLREENGKTKIDE